MLNAKQKNKKIKNKIKNMKYFFELFINNNVLFLFPLCILLIDSLVLKKEEKF